MAEILDAISKIVNPDSVSLELVEKRLGSSRPVVRSTWRLHTDAIFSWTKRHASECDFCRIDGCFGRLRDMSDAGREIVFDALADAHRRTLLDRLRTCNGQTLGALCHGLPISRQAVTKHLHVLEEADLIVSQRSGRRTLHYLNPVPLNAVALRWLKQFDVMPLDGLSAVEPEGNR